MILKGSENSERMQTKEDATTFPTLPANIAPENRLSQKETSIPTIHFQGLC